MASPVTDPALLAQLNASDGPKPVSDPELLAKLNDHVSVPWDVVKSGGIGLAKGAIGLAGTGGDAGSLIRSGVDAAANKLGVAPETVDKARDALKMAGHVLPPLGMLFGPTSGEIQKGIEAHTGEFYKPQTTAGEYAQTAGEFAPAALDPELLAGKIPTLAAAAKGLISRVLAPAAASETAGQVTKGTALEPYARVAGAVTGGGLADVLTRAKEAAAPTVAELKASYKTGIDHPDVKAVTFDPTSLANLKGTITADLESRGFRDRPNREAGTFADVKELENPTATMARAAGAPATVADVDSIRKSLGKTSQEVGPDFRPTSNAAAATAAVKHIDNWFDNLKQPDLLSGDISKAAPILNDARSDYAAAMRADTLEKKIGNAALQAGSSYAGGNINNATRQALRPLAKNDFAKVGGYSDAEKSQLAKAILGNVAGNTARQVGRLGPDAGLKGIEHVIAAVKTGGLSVPFSLASLGAKLGGDFATRRNVSKLDEMLRSRSPLAQRTAAANPVPVGQSGGQRALVNAMLASAAPRARLNVYPTINPVAQIPQSVPAQNQ